MEMLYLEILKNLSGSNTDGSFTMAISNSFLNPKQKNIDAAIIVFGIISDDVVCTNMNR